MFSCQKFLEKVNSNKNNRFCLKSWSCKLVRSSFAIMDIPANLCDLVISKMEVGLSQRRIAQDLEMPQSTVSSIIQRFRRTGKAIQDRHGKCGRKKVLTVRDERLISRASQQNPRATAKEIQRSVGGRVATVSVDTVKRALRSAGKISYRPVKSPSLSPSQMRVRFQWAKAHEKWTMDMWKKVRKCIS